MFGERVGGLRIENNHYFVSRLVSTSSLNFQYVTSSIKENTEEVTSTTNEGQDVSLRNPTRLLCTNKSDDQMKVEDFFKPKKSW